MSKVKQGTGQWRGVGVAIERRPRVLKGAWQRPHDQAAALAPTLGELVRERATWFTAMRPAALALIVISSGAVSAKPPEYWVCVNAQGVRAAQDRPCGADQQTISTPASVTAPQPARAAPSAPVTQLPDASTGGDQKNTFLPIISAVFKGAAAIMVLLVMVAVIKVMLRVRSKAASPRRSAPTISSDPWPDPPTPVLTEPNAGQRVPSTITTELQPPKWDMELLRALEWRRFEELCERCWTLKGYPAHSTGPGADGGVDIVIADRADSAKVFAVAQCKSWSKAVGVEPVRALWGSKDHFSAQLAIFYALSGFTVEAKQFAVGKHLKLVGGDSLLEQVRALPPDDQVALLEHVARGDYTTPSCPKCDIKMVRREGKGGKPDFWGCPNFRSCGARPIPMRE